MGILPKLEAIWEGENSPFLIADANSLRFCDVSAQQSVNLTGVRAGDVVALIGDFDPQSILTLLKLIDLKTVVVPLTSDTAEQHDYFFDSAKVGVVIQGNEVSRRDSERTPPLLAKLRQRGHPGLVLFSTGTTGRPKAILHDFQVFLKRFETPRPTLRTLSFLRFDHIGGLNTLFHTLFNRGVVVAPSARTVTAVLDACREHRVEVLPTTPTFLRLLLMSGMLPQRMPESVRIITYGTERMDQPTLDELCRLLPGVDFRQTFGMSELGILRVKSKARDSLFMRVGGEGVETKVEDGVLKIRSQSRMLGYLNAPSPFDEEGWYDTEDVVEERDGFYRVTGRTGDVINVGGLKFMPSEVERVALLFPGVALVKAQGRCNPITGQHVELLVQLDGKVAVDKKKFEQHMKALLPAHMQPRRIGFDSVAVGHRFKKV